MTAPLLEVRGLRVEIGSGAGSRVALDGLDFDIADGEVLGMVGESGAGKSLTGLALMGLLDAPVRRTGGEIRLCGERLDGLDAEGWRRVRGARIGMVFQDPLGALDPMHTVGAQLCETLRTHLPLGREAARAAALELLGEVGIPAPLERFGQYPHQLSGGLRQRVVIALALCARPRLLVADEPTTALDVSTQAQIMALLRTLCARRGMALLLITHDLGLVAQNATRVAVLYAGRLAELGPVAQVLGAPRHPYARGLVDCIPRVGRRLPRLAQIDGSMPALDAIPSGCAFHPRCARATPRCQEEPPRPGTGVHVHACWNPLDA